MKPRIIKGIIIAGALNVIMLAYSLFLLSDIKVGIFNIGCPYRFYQQFEISGSETPNHGWSIGKLLIDELFIIFIAGLMIFLKGNKHYIGKRKAVRSTILLSFFLLFFNASFSQHTTKPCSAKTYAGVIFDSSYMVFKSIDEQIRRIQLSCADITLAENILKNKLKALNVKRVNQGEGCPDIVRHLSKYYRQYVGFENNQGQKVIWINLFLDKELIKQAQLDLISVNDGCSNYWNIEVNISTQTLTNLYINGNG
ncbi:MAG: hypothetical protein QM687_17220 [Ferruginibacter sp.]